MNQILVVFASATTASRAKRRLTQAGYQAKVIQTPKALTIYGCSYSVLTNENCLSAIKGIARDLDVRIKGVFQKEGSEYFQMF